MAFIRLLLPVTLLLAVLALSAPHAQGRSIPSKALSGIPPFIQKILQGKGFNLTDITGVYNCSILASMSGRAVSPSAGDTAGHGTFGFLVFVDQTTGDYNLGIVANSLLSSPGAPTSVDVSSGAAGAAGTLQTSFGSLPWQNSTRLFNQALQLAIQQIPLLQFIFPNALYSYTSAWAIPRASTKALGNSNYKALVDAILAAPDQFYAQVASAAYPNGAVRGQFKVYKKSPGG